MNRKDKEPSERQIDFATAIAETVGADLPKKFTSKSYSAFIDIHLDEFYKIQEKTRYESGNVFQLEHSYMMSDGYNGDARLNFNPKT